MWQQIAMTAGRALVKTGVFVGLGYAMGVGTEYGKVHAKKRIRKAKNKK